jgi:hypothetical protein
LEQSLTGQDPHDRSWGNIDKLHHLGSPRAIESLYRELQEDKAKRGVLELTVLTLTAAVTSLLEDTAARPAASLNPQDFELSLKAQEEPGTGSSIPLKNSKKF